MKKLMVALFSLVLACWLGCSAQQSESTASVQQAVEKYLANRTDLSGMRVVVDKVSFEGDRANAAVTIVARNDPQAKMQMLYRLRKTSGGWEVEPAPSAEPGAHGGAAPMPDAGGGGLPSGHPPVGGETPQTGELPPGHPPLGGESPQAGELPPGHPPLGGEPAAEAPPSERR